MREQRRAKEKGTEGGRRKHSGVAPAAELLCLREAWSVRERKRAEERAKQRSETVFGEESWNSEELTYGWLAVERRAEAATSSGRGSDESSAAGEVSCR